MLSHVIVSRGYPVQPVASTDILDYRSAADFASAPDVKDSAHTRSHGDKTPKSCLHQKLQGLSAAIRPPPPVGGTTRFSTYPRQGPPLPPRHRLVQEGFESTSFDPASSTEVVCLDSGFTLPSNSWVARRNSKRARDFFEAPYGVSTLHPLTAAIPIAPPIVQVLSASSREQSQWPIDAAFAPQVQADLDVVVQSMLDISHLISDSASPTRAEFALLASQAVSAANKIYGEQEALTWSNNFVWPAAAQQRDLDDFIACGHSLEQLARQRITAAQGNQLLTPERATRTLHIDNPHLAAVLDVAHGVQVQLPANFIPNSAQHVVPPPSPAYLKLHSAVDKTYFDTHGAANLAIVLPRDVAVKYISNFHTSRLAWTTKPGKPGGRSLIDPTWSQLPQFHALNSIDVRDACKARWGAICNPTIEEVVHMILRAQDQFPQQEILLWLMDVKGAYTQLAFDPQHVCWMAAMLFSGAIMFFLAGIFGWCGQPFAFDTVTRAIRWEFHHRLIGPSNIYVDDGMGATTAQHLQHDLGAAASILEGLMGPAACAPGKTQAAPRLNIIGYNLDTHTCLVTIAEKNVLKALYGFMVVRQHQAISFLLMQQLASWGSRYALICPLLLPFTMVLHASMHRISPRAKITITPLIWSIVLLFRTLLALTVLRASSFSRSFESFRPLARPHLCPVLTFDASLDGIGILIYEWRQDTPTLRPLGGATISIKELNFHGKPEFQNIAEYIGAYFAVRLAAMLTCNLSYVWLVGDSMSALSWASKGSAHSPNATNAVCMFVLQAITLNLHIGDFSHIEGAKHWRCDLLSREGSWNELIRRDPSWSNITPIIFDPAIVHEILMLVNPLADWILDPLLWRAAQAACLATNTYHATK